MVPAGSTGAPTTERALRICVDINVIAADFLSRRKGGPGGASSRILDIIRSGTSPLGAIQLVISWRMLDTIQIILQRYFGSNQAEAEAVCGALSAIAELGPLGVAPFLILGGTGLLPMTDREDITVAEAAISGEADLLVTHDIEDFEFGPKSRLPAKRLLAGNGGKAAALLVQGPLHPALLIAVPEFAVGWLRGQTRAPIDVTAYRRASDEQAPPPRPTP